jgi:hypothetical protein
MSHQTWIFNVANSTLEARECLLLLYTDLRVRPVDLQVLLGSPSWTPDMWDLLPKIDVENLQNLEQKWSIYTIRLNIPVPNSKPLKAFYAGSAQNQDTSTGPGIPGEVSRIVGGHEPLLDMPPALLMALRRARRSGGHQALHVHEVGSLPGVERTYYSMASFPIIAEASYFQARIKLAIYRLENDHIIIVGTLPCSQGAAMEASASHHIKASRKYYSILRPSMCPPPPWIGLNKVLPASQTHRIFTSISSSTNLSLIGITESLQKFYCRTQKRFLDMSDISLLLCKELSTLEQEDKNLTQKIKQMYNQVLREHGLRYEPKSARCLRLRFPILWGLAHHVSEAQIIITETNLEYILDWNAIDWECVAQLAQSIAPKDTIHMYTKLFCNRTAVTYSGFFRKVFLYKQNFDAILGISHNSPFVVIIGLTVLRAFRDAVAFPEYGCAAISLP